MSFEFDPTITLSLVFSGITLAIAWHRTRRRDLEDRLKSGTERMDRHDQRIFALEQSVHAMPGKEDIHQLQLELVKQTGSLAEMRAVMAGNAKIMERLGVIVERHEQHLLDGGKR